MPSFVAGKRVYRTQSEVDRRAAIREKEAQEQWGREWPDVLAYKTEHREWPATTDETHGGFMRRMLAMWRDNRGEIPKYQYLLLRREGFPPPEDKGRGNAGKGVRLDEMKRQAANGTLSDADLKKLRARYKDAKLSEKAADAFFELGYDVRKDDDAK